MNWALRILVVFFILSTNLPARESEVTSLPQAIQMALEYRVEIKTAKLKNQSASLGVPIVESQLGWQMSAAAGMQHGLDTFGQVAEQTILSAAIARQQRSGDQISIQGNYQKDESDISSPGIFPNPVESYGINMNYRMPLQQGKDNPQYAFSEKQAMTDVVLSAAELQLNTEQISEIIIGIYHRLIDLQIQQREIKRAIYRTVKLEAFIKRNSQLGMAESKDRLAVQAKLAALRADKARLAREWQSQFTEFSKMTGLRNNYTTVVQFNDESRLPESLEDIIRIVLSRDAVILKNSESIALAEAKIQMRRDMQRDQLDMVLSLGNETRQGQRASGTLDENEWVGGVRIEYKLPFDRRGVDAQTQQGWLELDQTRLESQRYETDLKYKLAQWYEEWKMTELSTQQFQHRKDVEQKRYREVHARYREGRTDIREILDADEALNNADVLLAREKVRRSLMLSMLSNRLGIFTSAIEN